MSTQNIVEHALNEILHAITPIREDWDRRYHVIDEFRSVVDSIEMLRGTTVEPFGSFLSNLFTRWGDLDISIELFNGSYIASAGRKHKQTLLAEVMKSLRKKGGVRRLLFVSNAKVPILKFENSYFNISCDISINNFSGQMKSKFLFWISQIDPRFRDMVLLVKEWAKAQDINNPKTGTFNSYSLSLLILFHFQTCVPPIFPPLKELYPGNIGDELIGIRADIERHVAQVCDANIAKFRSERRLNQSSLSDLFITFLAKFSDISDKATEQGICTYTGQWEDIGSNMGWLPQTYAIFIEDPFERPENTARAVSSGRLTKISKAFRTTFLKLVSSHVNRNSLIPSLVRPEIVQCFPGVPGRYPSFSNGGYSRTDPGSGMGYHSATQFQRPRQMIHPNNGTSVKNKKAFQGQEASGQGSMQAHNHPKNNSWKIRQASQGQEASGQGYQQAHNHQNNVASWKPSQASQGQSSGQGSMHAHNDDASQKAIQGQEASAQGSAQAHHGPSNGTVDESKKVKKNTIQAYQGHSQRQVWRPRSSKASELPEQQRD